MVHGAHDEEEQHGGDDQEHDDRVDEQAVAELRVADRERELTEARLVLGIASKGVSRFSVNDLMTSAKAAPMATPITAADHVAPQDERSEILEHGRLLVLGSGQPVSRSRPP